METKSPWLLVTLELKTLLSNNKCNLAMRNSLPSILVVTLSTFLFTSLQTQGGTIKSELASISQKLRPEDEVSVIISLRDKIDLSLYRYEKRHKNRSRLIKALKSKANATQRPIRDLLKSQGAKRITTLWLTNSIAVRAEVRVILKLADHPGVAEIRLDYTLHMPETQYALAEPPRWNLNMIDAAALWNLGFTGQGIIVANMDSGVDLNHADLNPRWRGGTNSWYDPHGEHDSPYDDTGHGTQTMGIIVGGQTSGTAIGVAPDANWIAVKIFNDTGDASFSNIHLGFQWILDPDGDPNTDDSPDVVNNSWGIRNRISECFLEFYDDIQALKTAGIAVVFAAGNEGSEPNTSISPANYDNSFAVGSVDNSRTIADSSSRGPSPCHSYFFPQIVAPGVSIQTSDLTGGGAFPYSYATVSGTSFAAPHASGAMALLLSAFPDLSISQLEDALVQSATDLGVFGPDHHYGYGLINLTAAYEYLAGQIRSADFDGDGDVDLSDLAILIAEWLGTDCTDTGDCQSDLNGDGKVNLNDYAEFATQYEPPA